MKLLLFVSLSLACVAASYDGHKLIKAYPQNEGHLRVLNGLFENARFDVWHASPERYDVYVSAASQQALRSLLQTHQCPFVLSDYDIARDVRQEEERLKNRSPHFDYEDFNDLQTVEAEIERLAAQCIPGYNCSIEAFGYSVEQRPLKKLLVTKAGAKRRSIWLDATTHAREWITTATFMKIVKHIFDNHTNDEDVKHLLSTYDWHLVPVANPDGYAYSWASPAIKHRLWRKNRADNGNVECPGVDINRNADSAWGTEGASGDKCSASYRGPSVASEPETKALQGEFVRLGKQLVQIITMHSYGNYWLTSFGHIDNRTGQCYVSSDAKEMKRVANAAADAIEGVYNTQWKRGDICTTIYPASGSPLDFAKATAGVRYGGVPELRGSSFIVPPSSIHPSFREIWQGILASIKAIEKAEV